MGTALLDNEQVERRVTACNGNLQQIMQDPTFLSGVVTCDESWLHYYNPLIKPESETWQRPEEPKVKKISQQKSDVKAMILVFLNAKGYDLLAPLRSAGGEGEEMIRNQKVLPMVEHISWKHTKLKTNWVLHQDNAWPHTASLVTEWFEQNGIQLMAHPPYSPDIAPCDY